MTRRKQNCPKRMKWEGEGEGPPECQEEEGGSCASGDEEEGASLASVSSPASPPRLEPAVSADTLREGLSPAQESRSSGRPGSRDSACSERPPEMSPGLVFQGRRSPLGSPRNEEVLDFSTKRAPSPVLNLSKSVSPELPLNGPLDLSVGTRKRSLDESSPQGSPSPQPRKSLRLSEFKPVASPWTSPVVASHFPYFAAAVAAANSLSPKANSHPDIWNGKMKAPEKGFVPTPSDATKALEKMSELSKLGGDEFRPGKHSAWQSHWLNKGAEQAKDVLKCVWCKQSFPSLAAMTTHMKEAKHCGVNLPSSVIAPPAPPVPQPLPVTPPAPPPPTSKNNSDLNLLIKETMPLPRKLVRGQDVWLGKGAEQTRQILKCMWCGQSFRSLAEMTSHMQQTQHYTNIISQEQIISWKSAEEGKSNVNNNNSSSLSGGASGGTGGAAASGVASSHVSAVLTCKVCDQAFSSLKELSNHMVKNSHYKEHIMRSITESGSRRRQTREKRKKSLPVRKLLELERAQNELKNGESIALLGKHGRDDHSAGRITCEKCKEKIEMAVFVDHIRICVGADSRNLLKNALLSSSMLPDTHHIPQSITSRKKDDQRLMSPPVPTDLSVNSVSSKDVSTEGKGSSPSVLNAIEKLIEKSFDARSRHGPGGFVGPGVPGQSPMGSSILKRLGIDESVDYTKPLIDVQTMNLLRNYHRHDSQTYVKRERSGSESSSVSEKGRADSLTPERKYDQSLSATPRATPESRIQTPPSTDDIKEEDIKKEPPDSVEDFSSTPRIEVKQEIDREDDEDRRSYHSDEVLSKRMENRSPVGEEEDDRSQRTVRSPTPSPRVRSPEHSSPCRNSTSPSSDRSATPRSTSDKKGSLGALSSMFDNLPGGSGTSSSTEQGATKSSHPLAALQKLCDKTETQPPSRQSAAPTPAGGSPAPPPASPGSILAFSWACNDAVVTSDSIMKCAFCDTPFISKGAYRHHLSKMHFVKDGVIPEPVKPQSPAPAAAPSTSKPPAPPTNNNPKSPSQSFEESPHSKFLKYTELAKQLSSKYV